MSGRFPYQAIHDEFHAQVSKDVAAGIKPTHVDGHKYIHLLPGISGIVAEIAKQFHIPVMRVPYHLADGLSRPRRLPGAAVLIVLGKSAYRAARRARLWTCEPLVCFFPARPLYHRAIP